MQIKSVEDAKYCKQNNRHKYLLPEIILRKCKYVESVERAMKATSLPRQTILSNTDESQATATSIRFYCAFYVLFPAFQYTVPLVFVHFAILI